MAASIAPVSETCFEPFGLGDFSRIAPGLEDDLEDFLGLPAADARPCPARECSPVRLRAAWAGSPSSPMASSPPVRPRATSWRPAWRPWLSSLPMTFAVSASRVSNREGLRPRRSTARVVAGEAQHIGVTRALGIGQFGQGRAAFCEEILLAAPAAAGRDRGSSGNRARLPSNRIVRVVLVPGSNRRFPARQCRLLQRPDRDRLMLLIACMMKRVGVDVLDFGAGSRTFIWPGRRMTFDVGAQVAPSSMLPSHVPSIAQNGAQLASRKPRPRRASACQGAETISIRATPERLRST